MSVVDDVYTYLEAQGLAGGSTGWDLLRRRVMDDPAKNQLVVVTEDGGVSPEMSASSGIGDAALSDPGVLVSVRAEPWDGDACAQKAQAILDALHGLLNATLVGGGQVYLRIRAQTPEPIFAGFDDQGRPQHTVSFLLLKLS